MTENDVELLGFDMVKLYHHDDWYTKRFEKGFIQIEFTYRTEDDKIETIDITIDEIVGNKVSLKDLKLLDRTLN